MFDNLTTLATVLYSCRELSDEERPKSAEEWRELDESVQRQLASDGD